MVVGRYILVVIACWFVAVPPLQAAEIVKDLYQSIEVVSVEATEQEINQAMARGLAAVVTRVSGSGQSLLNPVIKEGLQNPKQYLSQFRFEPSTEIKTNLLGEVVHTKKFVLDFDVFRVQSLLASGLVPVWDDMRPTVLTWIAIERTNRREILSSLSSDDWFVRFDQSARTHGLSYQLPEMDLVDQLSINVSEVWGLFADVVSAASSRYQPEMVVAGRIYPIDQNRWGADFLLILNERTQRVQFVEATYPELFDRLFSLLAKTLSDQYAVILGGNNLSKTQLGVTGVSSLQTYGNALALFESMGQVQQVQVTGLNQDRLLLNISGFGSTKKLLDNLHLYRQYLVPLSDDARPENRPEAEHWFGWQAGAQSE